jgi:hypothetical protein
LPKGLFNPLGEIFLFANFGALKTAPYKIPFISGQVVIASKPYISGFYILNENLSVAKQKNVKNRISSKPQISVFKNNFKPLRKLKHLKLLFIYKIIPKQPLMGFKKEKFSEEFNP